LSCNRSSLRESVSGSHDDGDDFSERVTGLDEDTRYYFRACAEDDDGDDSSGAVRSFRTDDDDYDDDDDDDEDRPDVFTYSPTSVSTNYAVLNGYVRTNDDDTDVWFDWGRTYSLGNRTTIYHRDEDDSGTFRHSFTRLSPNTTYYYRAVARNDNGTDYGVIKSFKTKGFVAYKNYNYSSKNNNIVYRSNTVVRNVETKKEEKKQYNVGYGISCVAMEIENGVSRVSSGDRVTYEIEWENLCEKRLDDVTLAVEVSGDLEISDHSAGLINSDRDMITFDLGTLDEGERGSKVLRAEALSDRESSLALAYAVLAYDNPWNGAQENVIDTDSDKFTVVYDNDDDDDSVAVVYVDGGIYKSLVIALLILLLIALLLLIRWLYRAGNRESHDDFVDYEGSYSNYTPYHPDNR